MILELISWTLISSVGCAISVLAAACAFLRNTRYGKLDDQFMFAFMFFAAFSIVLGTILAGIVLTGQ